jgi:E3 ubiquitin-protein ligase RNF14
MEGSEEIARCADAFEDELTVLQVSQGPHLSEIGDADMQSIYDSLVHVQPTKDDEDYKLITLEIPITLSATTITELSSPHAGEAASQVTPLKLSHLPPIKVDIRIPPSYPLYQPPDIIRLSAPVGSEADQWLDKRYRLEIERRLGMMWGEDKEIAGEGSGVIWRWWEWIGSGECLTDLGLLKEDTLRYVDPHCVPYPLMSKPATSWRNAHVDVLYGSQDV